MKDASKGDDERRFDDWLGTTDVEGLKVESSRRRFFITRTDASTHRRVVVVKVNQFD